MCNISYFFKSKLHFRVPPQQRFSIIIKTVNIQSCCPHTWVRRSTITLQIIYQRDRYQLGHSRRIIYQQTMNAQWSVSQTWMCYHLHRSLGKQANRTERKRPESAREEHATKEEIKYRREWSNIYINTNEIILSDQNETTSF